MIYLSDEADGFVCGWFQFVVELYHTVHFTMYDDSIGYGVQSNLDRISNRVLPDLRTCSGGVDVRIEAGSRFRDDPGRRKVRVMDLQCVHMRSNRPLGMYRQFIDSVVFQSRYSRCSQVGDRLLGDTATCTIQNTRFQEWKRARKRGSPKSLKKEHGRLCACNTYRRLPE